jgi:signal transduction histidine kinase
MTLASESPKPLSETLFAGGGEMGALMREHDWSQTPLGAIKTWSQSLRTVVGICLSSPVPHCVIWGRELILLYNDGYRSLIGDSHPQAFGRPIQENTAFWHNFRPLLEGILQNGQPAYFANDLQRIEQNCPLKEAQYFFSPIFDETGQAAGIFHGAIPAMPNSEPTTVQASGTEQLEESTFKQLQESEAKYRTLFDSIDEGYLLCDVIFDKNEEPIDILYLEANPAAVRLAGRDFSGRRMREIDPNYEDYWYELIGRVALTGESVRAEHYAELHGRWFDFYASKVGGPESRRVASVFQDTTDRKRAEVAQQAFFSNISHEFRTPLTLLMGGIQAVLDDSTHPPTSAARSHIELAQRNSLRLLKLVNTLLDFSRIAANRLEATYELTDLATFTAELASMFRSLVERASLRFVVDCPPLLEPVYVDRQMWEKIVFNLISNAFKFTFTGEITVRLHHIGDQVELVVQDSGIGIPSAEIPRLFERFHQVKGTQGRTFEGSGIGLSLVQELVKLHRGTVEVSSVEGEGSCFRVFIPTGCAHLPAERIGASRKLVSAATGASPYVEEALRWLTEENESTQVLTSPERTEITFAPTYAHVPSSASSRILLVDDNADMRDYLKRLLSERWQIETAANGAIALEVIQQQLPDLVLADVMMPLLDGFQLLKTLRADPITQSIPIILLSARAGEEAMVEGLQAGADDYLIKPFSARELIARVETQLQMSRLRQELSANRFKNEFLMTITHELQSPLATILGWARFLQTKSLAPDAMARALAAIERNATIEAKLVKNLLDVASILSGKLRLKSQVVDLASLVRNVTTIFREAAEAKRIHLVETISEGVPSNVFADGDRLKQAISSLLENAIKFTPEGGQVTIRLDRLNSGVQIIVSDTGIGIRSDFLTYVFERFTQAEVPSRHTPGGVGLGLAIARHIVELHHGMIEAASEGEGQGATFTVRLPLKNPAQPNFDAPGLEP